MANTNKEELGNNTLGHDNTSSPSLLEKNSIEKPADNIKIHIPTNYVRFMVLYSKFMNTNLSEMLEEWIKDDIFARWDEIRQALGFPQDGPIPSLDFLESLSFENVKFELNLSLKE